MQQVLNAAERRQAFAKFLSLFILTVFMMVIIMAVNMQVPLRATAMLSEELGKIEAREAAQQRITEIVESATHLIDSIGTPGANNQYLRSMVGAKLKELTLQSGTHGPYHDMNKVVLAALLKYCEVKNALLELSESPKLIEDLRARLRDTESELHQAKQDLDFFRKYTTQ